MPKPFNCAVCGSLVPPEDFDLCLNCGWEDDSVQENDPDYRGGANFVSLNEAKANYAKCGKAMSPEAKAEKKAYWAAHYAKQSAPS